MDYGMFRAAAVSPKLKVADTTYNTTQIKSVIDKAVAENVRLLVTPELSVTGYTCADLFFSRTLLSASDKALQELAEYTFDKDIIVVVGAPYQSHSKLYNCAFVLYSGRIVCAVPKQNLANYNEFYEKRWFESGKGLDDYDDRREFTVNSQCLVRTTDDIVIGFEMCEDLWVTEPPSGKASLAGAQIIVNLSASDEYVSKAQYRRDLISGQSARCIGAYIYAGAGVGESSTDLVFSGATVIAENGTILAEGKRFQRDNVITIADIDVEKLNTLRQKNMSFEYNKDNEFEIIDIYNDGVIGTSDGVSSIFIIEDSDCDEFDSEESFDDDDEQFAPPEYFNDLKYRYVDSHPFVPADKTAVRERCEEIFAIQASGLAKRLEHVGSKGCVVGISGGLDSTLALLVSVEAMRLVGKAPSDIIGVTMPGFGTTDRTYNNALDLMHSLGVTVREIDIKAACRQHMADIGHDESIKDITYENTQARERTQILFDLANKTGCLLVGTGDLSELAMGWCTYNGDHMSMYGVNASVPKTLVRYLVDYVASVSDERTKAILLDVLDTPVSPELLPPDKYGKIAQKTEDNIGPYELHDFFLYNFVRFGFSKEKLQRLAEKAFDGKYDSLVIAKWLNVFLKRFFISQFKRSCIPDSPKVGSVSLSPRGDWRMPSDASFDEFLK